MIKEIQKYCKSKGLSFQKCDMKNGFEAYKVNGMTYTKRQLIDAYRAGILDV